MRPGNGLREARAAAAVVHEHVVAIHNVETDGESPFLVMQFVAGESLQQRIDREGPLELCEILRIGMQTAAGLAAAHAQGLVHRDVKPSNILLEQGIERALLTDFGLARASDDASLTHTGYHPGTPQYMSPEQARGESVDARSDLFSLGSVIYTMCTGRVPFRADSSYGILRRITDNEPGSIREINPAIPTWLETIVGGLHAKSPDKRFNSAGELHELLEQCLAHAQQPTSMALPADCRIQAAVLHKRIPATIVRRVALFAAGAIAVAALIAGAAYFGGGPAVPVSPATPKTASPELPKPRDDAAMWTATSAEIDSFDLDLTSFEMRSQRIWDGSIRNMKEQRP